MCFHSRMDSVLTISEVSRRSGVASSALRFYEERALIASERAGSGHRRYSRPVLRRIAFIVFAQRVGLTLEEIGAELAKLPGDRAPARRDWSRLSGTWTARIDERIAELQRLRVGLTECSGGSPTVRVLDTTTGREFDELTPPGCVFVAVGAGSLLWTCERPDNPDYDEARLLDLGSGIVTILAPDPRDLAGLALRFTGVG